MSLYTNDLETIQECFGDGVLMFCDALFLGLLAFIKMWRMDASLTMMAMIPAFLMFLVGSIVGRVMTRRWEERQQAFADPVRLCPGKLFGHRGGQSLCQGDQRADGLPQAEPGK